MEDEEFEKYWKKIVETCTMFSLEGGVDEVYIPSCFRSPLTKQKIKQILEEIYQKGHDENVHYQLLKALTKKEAKDDEL